MNNMGSYSNYPPSPQSRQSWIEGSREEYEYTILLIDCSIDEVIKDIKTSKTKALDVASEKAVMEVVMRHILESSNKESLQDGKIIFIEGTISSFEMSPLLIAIEEFIGNLKEFRLMRAIGELKIDTVELLATLLEMLQQTDMKTDKYIIRFKKAIKQSDNTWYDSEPLPDYNPPNPNPYITWTSNGTGSPPPEITYGNLYTASDGSVCYVN